PGGLAQGGAIIIQGSPASITNSTFTGNVALGGAGGPGSVGGSALGGAIALGFPGFVDTSALTLTNSLLSNNVARGGAGGVGGNGGDAQGGGLWVGPGARAALRASTVTENQAIGGAAGAGGSAGQGKGGGLYIDALAQVCLDLVTQRRLHGNHASTSGDDVFGTFDPCPRGGADTAVSFGLISRAFPPGPRRTRLKKPAGEAVPPSTASSVGQCPGARTACPDLCCSQCRRP